MRILICRNAWGHSDFGGAESMCINLAEAYKKKGHTVFIASGTRALLERSTQRGVSTQKVFRNPLLDYSGWRHVLLPVFFVGLGAATISYLVSIRRLRPDALHVHSRDDYISASIAARLLGVRRVIWTDHAELKIITQNTHSLLKGVPGKVVLWAQRFADAIITVSHKDKQQISANTHQRLQPSVIYNGVTEPETPKKSTDSYTFCFATRLNRQKGIYETLDAFQIVSKKLPNSTLLVNFDETTQNASDIRSYIRALNNPHIFVTHPYDDQAIWQGSIFVMPSYMEGMSLALIKACARKKAIITTGVGGTPEMLTDKKSALFVPTQDTKKLAETMHKLATSAHLRKSLGNEAHRNYYAKFRLEDAVNRYIQALS